MDLSDIKFSFILDLVPLVLAVYALIRLYSINKQTVVVFLARAISVLLILCQVTWIHSYLNHFELVTSFIDSLWSVFNATVMILVLVITEREVKANKSVDCSDCSLKRG